MNPLTALNKTVLSRELIMTWCKRLIPGIKIEIFQGLFIVGLQGDCQDTYDIPDLTVLLLQEVATIGTSINYIRTKISLKAVKVGTLTWTVTTADTLNPRPRISDGHSVCPRLRPVGASPKFVKYVRQVNLTK